MAKLVLALLCAAFALSAARQLHQTTALAKITDLPENLQKLNARLTAAATSKVHPMSLLDHYEAYEKYEKYGQAYKPEYRGDEKYYEEAYEADKYAPKYEAPEKYAPKYEAPEKYAPKYEDKYYEEVTPHHPKEAYGYDEYAPKGEYGYGPSKVTVKLYEKYRSGLRPQTNNNNTFQFTSELTCTDPTAVKDIEHTHDGLITFPLMPDRTKLVTVGVCEWTVTLVAGQPISETATLKGSTNVLCKFNEEAERHCKNEYLCDGMTVSGQGLVYTFDALPEEPKYGDKYEKKYEKYAEKDEDAVTPVEKIDVFLSLINGVINAKKHMKWDNGAIQYFAGTADSASAITPIKVNGGYSKQVNPIGQYTMVFK